MDSDDVPLLRKSILVTASLLVLNVVVLCFINNESFTQFSSQLLTEQVSCDYVSLDTNSEANKIRVAHRQRKPFTLNGKTSQLPDTIFNRFTGFNPYSISEAYPAKWIKRDFLCVFRC